MDAIPPELLISAYAQGIFPMGSEDEVRWYSPDPRGIIPLEQFHASKTLLQTYRSGKFEIHVNRDFRKVMEFCAERPDDTWITEPIIDSYCHLHELGFAHSVEAWRDGALVGGLYGVALGGAFFGESMFHRVRDASKVALVGLVMRMKERGFTLLDSQFTTPHLSQFGGVEITRAEYLRRLADALEKDCQFADRASSKRDGARPLDNDKRRE